MLTIREQLLVSMCSAGIGKIAFKNVTPHVLLESEFTFCCPAVENNKQKN